MIDSNPYLPEEGENVPGLVLYRIKNAIALEKLDGPAANRESES
jgi:hypothetical protein